MRLWSVTLYIIHSYRAALRVSAYIFTFSVTIENSTLLIIDEARHLTVILYTALRRIKWPKMSENMMKKFLSMLDSSIEPTPSDKYHYTPLRKGMEMCIKNMMWNINHKDLIRLVRIDFLWIQVTFLSLHLVTGQWVTLTIVKLIEV